MYDKIGDRQPTREEYAEYIARAIRYVQKETGLKWPDDSIIVCKSWVALSNLDTLMEMPVHIMDMPSSFDLFVSFPSDTVGGNRMQKAFLEYVESYEIEALCHIVK